MKNAFRALLSLAAGAVTTLASAIPSLAAGPVLLQPHRIAYEVSLGPKSGGAITRAEGLIALEFTGNACEGFATNFRQETQLSDADGQAKNLDFRISLWEEGVGKQFRFTVLSKINGQVLRDAEGTAKRVSDGSVSVAMLKPRGGKGDFDGSIAFPSAMMRALVEAAQRGERLFNARLFDGSEGGEKVFDTIATIGKPLEGERNARLEPAMRDKTLDGITRWPVSIAYYENTPGDRVPVYTLRSVTFANGVVSDLVFEFPDFSLAARAVRYDVLPAKSCAR